MGELEVRSAALWLGKLVLEEIKYLGGVKDKAEELKTELNALAAFLMEAVKTRRHDNLVQNAVSDARYVAYDCQDIIETYILQVAHHGYEDYKGFKLGSVMRWACLAVNAASVLKINSKIGDLNKRISALKSRMIGYGIPARIVIGAENPDLDTSGTTFYSHESEEYVVVGLENDLSELVERLMNPTDKTVIALCGMGGIGKSTLAREIYKHDKLRGGGYFEAFGWVHVSQRFQPDAVIRTLLYSLVPENDYERRRAIEEHMKAGRAHGALYDLLREVKCLVIVDDIWTSADWAKLQAGFPRKNATGSKIVLTTRNQETISGLDPNRVYLHPIKGLDDTKSWELFQKITVPANATCSDCQKEELGQEMLQHCNGVPLAIVVLGKVLQTKKDVDDWRRMRDDISAQIKRGGAPDPYKEVYDVLRVSYDELPFHLQHCFLHLASFPEDYEISTRKLFPLWVGEGIVSKEGSNKLEEDVAEIYLNELVSRNMVQVSTRALGTGRIETCRLHDLMRDICMEIANKEGFLQWINCQRSMLLTNGRSEDHVLMTSIPSRDKRILRLAVCVSDQEPQALHKGTISASAEVSRAPNLRSFVLFSINELGLDENCEKFGETISRDFPLLRVFSCENLRVKGKLPEQVGNLIHLRYLSLFNTRINELPLSIDKLLWLQTLDIRVNEDVVFSLPNILWKMKQLRHLYLPYYGGLGLAERKRLENARQRYLIKGDEMLRLDGLGNLQTVLHLDLDRVNVQGLSKLERINTVMAACETGSEALHIFLQCSSMRSFTLRLHAQILNEDPMILASCQALHQLDIHVDPCASFSLKKPLSVEMLPKSLVSLAIVYYKFANDPLPILEKLPNLVHLSLHMCYDGSRMVCSTSGFPELNDLCFDGLFTFSHWEVEQGALQKLKSLLLINCPIKKIPNALPSSVNVTTMGSTNIERDNNVSNEEDNKDQSKNDQAIEMETLPTEKTKPTASFSATVSVSMIEPGQIKSKLPYLEHHEESHHALKRNETSGMKNHPQSCQEYHANSDNMHRMNDSVMRSIADKGERIQIISVPKVCQADGEVVRKALARMIIVNELPLVIVEHEEFRAFCKLLNPEFCVPSHRAISADCYSLFLDEKEKMKSSLCDLSSRVALTTNTWTSGQGLSYMSLTVHFINENWNLQKRIIKVCHINDSSSELVGEVVKKCLNEWGINKVMAITSDSASYTGWGDNLLDADFLHMRCAANMLELVVRDGLQNINTSVLKIRAAVRYVKSSPDRLQEFTACIEEENIESGGNICLDDETRWSSTFLMLDSAVKFRKAFDKLQSREELTKFGGVPSDDDWNNVNAFLPILKIFYAATLNLSKSCCATSNFYVPHIYGIADLISTYCESEDMNTRNTANQMKVKFDKYWGNVDDLNILLFVSLVIDPRHKLAYVEWIVRNSYDDDIASMLLSKIKATLQSIFDTYKKAEVLYSSQHGKIENEQLLDVEQHLKLKYKMKMETLETRKRKEEMEKYLDDECEPDDDNDFDILQWWKAHQKKYPILATIARDLLAIPVSTGGCHLKCCHASLKPRMVEALVCAHDWLRTSHSLLPIEESLVELEEGTKSSSSEASMVNIDE